ncbi:MAG: hydroxymethylglutaryl-CoA lyase [Candidatus Limnocylindria bacterium]
MAAGGVTIVEVGLRDGLQNEPTPVDTDGKLHLLHALLDAGIRELEVTSFVRPDLVPQLADAEALAAALPPRDDVTYVALVANERGYERAAAAGIRELIFVLAATDAFNERNVRRTVEGSLSELSGLCRRGERDGVNVRAAIAVSFGCPYSGRVEAGAVLRVAQRCVESGALDLNIADTIGVANPAQVTETFEILLRGVPSVRKWAAHFHDTRGLGLANAWSAAGIGIRRFDASIAGLGGCPFAPGATGNVATEDTAYMFDEAGLSTRLDREKLFAAVDVAEELVGRPSAGRVKKAERATADVPTSGSP